VATKEGGDSLDPFLMEMVLVWRCLSSSLAAAKGRKIRGYGWGL
jgi:hypothetical protein